LEQNQVSSRTPLCKGAVTENV